MTLPRPAQLRPDALTLLRGELTIIGQAFGDMDNDGLGRYDVQLADGTVLHDVPGKLLEMVS